VTNAVLADAKEWQSRPLEAVYPIVYLDALVVKIRDGQAVKNHACYLAIGVNTDGERDVLGIWFQRTEGAKFWLAVLTELKQRGVEDVLVCCVDGLRGFPAFVRLLLKPPARAPDRRVNPHEHHTHHPPTPITTSRLLSAA
jgi:putative transposase